MNIPIKNGGDGGWWWRWWRREGGRAVGARWGFLIRTVYLVSTKNKIKTVVRRSPFSSQVMEDAGKAAARPVEVNRWWWGPVARRREAWRISSLIPHYLPSLTQVSSSLSAGEDRQREGGGAVRGGSGPGQEWGIVGYSWINWRTSPDDTTTWMICLNLNSFTAESLTFSSLFWTLLATC